ncbi:MAG: hypothetical protein U0804_15615 [Gemmataceae bacterium]
MPHVLSLAGFVGLLVATGSARAEWVTTRVTPEKAGDHLYEFAVKVERVKQRDAGDLLDFHVTVTVKNAGGVPLGPRRRGVLEVFAGTDLVSNCEVRPTERAGVRTFAFRVAASHAEKSKFVYSETVEPEDQGFSYWFYLQDFVRSK